ncbi:MAG: hypothetical protein PHF29_06340 [Candidatus Riflebacteria bacterium]|nr:hypothetical protein [Candidatus Riflebacteria bacterium]
MLRDKHFILLLFSLLVSAIFGHFHAQAYKTELNITSEKEAFEKLQAKSEAYFTMSDAAGEYEIHDEHKDKHEHKHEDGPCGCMSLPETSEMLEPPAQGDCCGKAHDHEHGHAHAHDHKHIQVSESPDVTVSPGLALLLRQLGFAELAANLLWVQMDADSHREMWHRVDFALDLIPALDPTFIEAYLLKSFFLDTYRKEHEKALDVLEKAVKYVANRIEIWQQIAVLCLNHGNRHGSKRNLPRALEAFGTMLRFSEAPEYAIRFYAITLAAMERRDEAIKILKQTSADKMRHELQRELDLKILERIKSGEKF